MCPTSKIQLLTPIECSKQQKSSTYVYFHGLLTIQGRWVLKYKIHISRRTKDPFLIILDNSTYNWSSKRDFRLQTTTVRLSFGVTRQFQQLVVPRSAGIFHYVVDCAKESFNCIRTGGKRCFYPDELHVCVVAHMPMWLPRIMPLHSLKMTQSSLFYEVTSNARGEIPYYGL